MPRRPVRFAIVLLTVSASSIFSTTASVVAVSEAELCFGQVPTIVGAPGDSLQGTDGPDVVLSTGADSIETGEGDDLVCDIGAPADPDSQGYIDAGAGNDRVDASQSGFKHSILLGEGADEYIGGPAFDLVDAGDYGADSSRDVIKTAGPASDWVISGGGADAVHLGSGRDRLFLQGLPSAEGVFDGGSGSNFLGLEIPHTGRTHSWTVDNRAERLLRDRKVIGRWEDFNRFGLFTAEPIKFLGSDEKETLVVWQQYRIDAHMGGGDDVVQFADGMPDSRLDGGKGTDLIRYEALFDGPRASVVVNLDLARGVLRDARPSRKASTWRVVHFENAHVLNYGGGGSTSIKGTNGPNHLNATRSSDPAVIEGMGGDDILSGGQGRDVLIGGPGSDAARGGLGSDRCDAEVRVNCER